MHQAPCNTQFGRCGPITAASVPVLDTHLKNAQKKRTSQPIATRNWDLFDVLARVLWTSHVVSKPTIGIGSYTPA